jgi:hypothetical protein
MTFLPPKAISIKQKTFYFNLGDCDDVEVLDALGMRFLLVQLSI